MGRYALIREVDGVIANVIVADNPEIASEIAGALGCTAREVVTEDETPTTRDALVSRACEPGGRLLVGDVVERAPPPSRSERIDEARRALELAAIGEGDDADRARRALAELDGDAAPEVRTR